MKPMIDPGKVLTGRRAVNILRGLLIVALMAMILIPGIGIGKAQSGRRPQKTGGVPSSNPGERQRDTPPADKEPAEKPADKPIADTTPTPISDDGTIRLDTSLVNIPVSVLDRNGRFIPDLQKRDFRLYEDNTEQQIDSLQTIETPFNVILLIDTSGSTRFRLDEIQMAATAFIGQLRSEDRVMVISFAGRYKVECHFTTDRQELREAINQTRTGGGTALYNAVEFALTQLEKLDGRKAMVLFTDGVDNLSRKATAVSTIAAAEESGALVYPISYDTEDSMLGPGSRGGRGGRAGGGMPPIFGPRWPSPMPGGGRRRWPISSARLFQWPRSPFPQGGGGSAGDYRRGVAYLQELADVSGGRLYHAESIASISGAFSRIAEELRHQYSIGYYPSNTETSNRFRAVRVKVTSPDYVVRARRGYRR